MYQSLFSALLFGLLPSFHGISTDHTALERVDVAPPTEVVEIADNLSASGVVIYERASGKKVFEKFAQTQRPMASLTKLMTALIIVENHAMDEYVQIPQSVSDVTGNKAYLPPGAQFSVGDLLSALLINSANDAAHTLAIYHSGSVSAFSAEMNKRARTLGMTATSFRNAAGLDDPSHWSTPTDMAGLSLFVLTKPEIASRMAKAGERIYSSNGESIQLYHTHALLHQLNPVVAGKTGTTSQARQCLMSLFAVEGKEYIAVLMHSNQRYKDMSTILSAFEEKSASVAARK